MEAQRALNALEQYIALARTTTSPRAVTDTIIKATSDPNTYVFAELLQQPAIQSLRGTEHATYLIHLEIFAWGTWEEYSSTQNLPPLNEAQAHKLRLLTLITLLTNPPTPTTDTQSYDYLLPRLSLASPAELEKLVQSALYASLLAGHIDPLHSRLAITSVAPLRDLPPDSLPHMTRVLEAWESRCDETLAEIEGEIERIKVAAKERTEQEQRREAQFEDAVANAEVRKSAWDSGAVGSSGGAEPMVVDGGPSSGRFKKKSGRTRGGKM